MKDATPTVTLVVGCGYVGSVVQRIASRNSAAWGLRRHAPTEADPVDPADQRIIAADVTDREALAAAWPSGVTQVVYSVGATGRTAESYEAAYLVGLSNVLGLCPPTCRVVFTSSTSVYAQDDGRWVDEWSPTTPEHFTGQIMRRAEGLLEAWSSRAEAQGGRGVALRCGGIYGPGRTRLINRVRSGDAQLSGDLAAFTNRIHRDDCARAVVHLLAQPHPAPIYLGVDCAPASSLDVNRWLARELGKEVPEAPAPILRRSKKRCSNALLRCTGFSFHYPSYREGYRQVLETRSS